MVFLLDVLKMGQMCRVTMSFLDLLICMPLVLEVLLQPLFFLEFLRVNDVIGKKCFIVII